MSLVPMMPGDVIHNITLAEAIRFVLYSPFSEEKGPGDEAYKMHFHWRVLGADSPYQMIP